MTATDPHTRIRATVSALMSLTGDTTTTLGTAIGQQRQTVYRKLRGERDWTLDDVWGLAAHFGMDPVDLIAGIDHATAKLPSHRRAETGGGRRSTRTAA